MSKLALIVPALLAASCAAHRNEPVPLASLAQANAAPQELTAQAESPPAVSAVQAPAEVNDVKTVQFEELDNGLVCERRERSASRISRRVCYTREEHAAYQAAEREQAQKYAQALSRDREWREAQDRAEQERRRQGMAGF